MGKTRQFCYISLHDEVKLALTEWSTTQHVDIAFVPLLRFLISYAHTNHIREDYDQQARESLKALDDSNEIASEGKTNGRLRERIQTSSDLIVGMSEDERYISLLCGLHALDIAIEELVI